MAELAWDTPPPPLVFDQMEADKTVTGDAATPIISVLRHRA